MRSISYSIATLVAVLLLTLLITPSFGSNILQQADETQQQPKKCLHIMASSEEQLFHDVRVYILSFITKQDDLLSAGGISKSWRQVAQQIWTTRDLIIPKEKLTEQDCTTLAQGIFVCVDLNKKITGEKIETLIRAFNGTFHLHRLVLSNNNIEDEEAIIIAEAIKTSPSLVTLELDGNTIEDMGAKALGEGLKLNTSLTTLDLDYNYIKGEGAKALGEGLRFNTSLTTLSLKGNIIGVKGIKALIEDLKYNASLTTLALTRYIKNDDVKKALEDLKHTRPSLTVIYGG